MIAFLYLDDSKAMLIGQLELLRHGLITEAQLLAGSIHVDEDNEVEVEAGEIKTKKKVETNKVADIEEKVLQFKEAAGLIEGQPECPPTRSVESTKESILKNLKERKTCRIVSFVQIQGCLLPYIQDTHHGTRVSRMAANYV